MPTPHAILDDLERILAARKALPPGEKSYVRSLLDAGVPKIGKKLVEESYEAALAGLETGPEARAHLTAEAADVLFHLLVLLAHADLPLADVEAELTRRFGTSGIDEKASRPK